MRILLCQSITDSARLGQLNQIVFPLGLAYLASTLKKDYEVYCWDPNVSSNPFLELQELLEKVQPQVVGISLRNVDNGMSNANACWHYSSFHSMLQSIHKKAPYSSIIVGGAGFSMFSKEIMQENPEIDFGVVCEGEQSFSQLLKNLDHPERINNLAFRKNGKIYFTEIRYNEDLESLPLPSRELFDLRPYKKKSYSMNIISKRGCAFNCIFCSNDYISGSKCRIRKPQSVVDEIEKIYNELDIDNLRFADSTFNYPFDHAQQICDEIKKRKLGISWTADFHPAFINKTFVRKAIDSGCGEFIFSPDGASDRALSFLKKGMRVEHIKQSIASIKEVEGVKACYNFMFDLPRYNSEHLIGLLGLVSKMEYSLGEKLSGIYLTKIRIYPHSSLYELAIREGIVNERTNILQPIYYPANSVFGVGNTIANLMAKSSFVIEKLRECLTPSNASNTI